ncbi:MAG: hypothetical protein L3K19_06135 [Thermoplasmata archaeon]|nr:hypothetical protein [Thermoplasmata archaeon]
MYVVDLGSEIALLILGLLVLATIWWARQVGRGMPFRPVVLGVLSIGYFLLFLLFETGDWLALDDVAPFDLALLLLAGAGAYYWSLRTTRILHLQGGRQGYRGSPVLVLLWLLLLLLEVYVQQVILGHVTVFHLVVIRGLPSPTSVDPTSISHPYRVVIATVDALFALGTGLALGNNAGLFTIFGHAGWKRRAASRA